MSAPHPRVGAVQRRPPKALSLVREPRAEDLGATIDWSSWYLDWDDDVGQSLEQDQVVDTIRSSLKILLAEQGRGDTWVGVDAFFAWVRSEPRVRVSPDVYTLAVPPPTPLPRMLETWRAGHTPPVFALEVVSDDWKKDYDDAPEKYALLGAEELVVFDADAARGAARAPRVALQVFRREGDGAFVQVYRGAGPAPAMTIGAWLVARRTTDAKQVLRLSRDPAGLDVVPTAEELGASATRRADDEKRRADDEKRRADDEKRRADDEKRRADALEAELARTRAKQGA